MKRTYVAGPWASPPSSPRPRRRRAARRRSTPASRRAPGRL